MIRNRVIDIEKGFARDGDHMALLNA